MGNRKQDRQLLGCPTQHTKAFMLLHANRTFQRILSGMKSSFFQLAKLDMYVYRKLAEVSTSNSWAKVMPSVCQGASLDGTNAVFHLQAFGLCSDSFASRFFTEAAANSQVLWQPSCLSMNSRWYCTKLSFHLSAFVLMNNRYQDRVHSDCMFNGVNGLYITAASHFCQS